MFRSCSRLLSQAFTRGYRKLPRLEDVPDAHLLPTIALVGRPNVGKSALFNRLVHRREALVFDTPSDHVTRDYREGLAQLGDLQFRVIDTSGLEPAAPSSSLQGRAAALTRGVLHDSHGVVMLLDARQGFVPGDEQLLSWLRRNNTRPLVIAANKADTRAGSNNLEQIAADLASVGQPAPVAISATAGEGLADLYQLLQPVVDAAAAEQHLRQQQRQGHKQSLQQLQPQQEQEQQPPAGNASLRQQHQQQRFAAVAAAVDLQLDEAEPAADAAAAPADAAAAPADAEEAAVDALVQQHLTAAAGGHPAYASSSSSDDDELDESSEGLHHPDDDSGSAGPLRLAILGLPNVGKSTLMNTLLGYERSLTGPEPGLTRDPTYGWLHHGGLDVQLVDTAGWKKASALAPTQGPTVTPSAAAAAGAAGSKHGKQQAQGSSSGSSTAALQQPAGVAGEAADAGSSSSSSTLLGKQLADASLAQARRALGACHVVVLLLDAQRLLTLQQAITRLELQLASLALDQGKALVVALNKSDAVPGGPAAAEALQGQVAKLLEDKFLAAGQLPVLLLSAKEGEGTGQLLDAVVGSYGKWNKRVSSHKLRSTLAKHTTRFFGTGGTGYLLQRIKWATQLKPRPPTFVLLLRGSAPVDEGGQRFLSNVLRDSLGLHGVPLRLYLRYNKRRRDDEHTIRKQQAAKKRKLLAWQAKRRAKKRLHKRG